MIVCTSSDSLIFLDLKGGINMMTLQDKPAYSTNHFEIIEIDFTSKFFYLFVFKSYIAPSHW